MSAFNGKITKAASVSATASIEAVTLDSSMFNDEYAVMDITYKKTVNGSSSGNITVGFQQVWVRPIANKAWVLAAGKVQYDPSNKKVVVPDGGAYDTTKDLDISSTYKDGQNSVGVKSCSISRAVRTGNTYTCYVNITLTNGASYSDYSAGSHNA